MKGLMMDYQLTLPPILRRAEMYFPEQEIVSRLPDKSFHRYTFADFGRRARQLAVALQGLGLERGTRVATLAWNNYAHLEAYFGIPCAGLVLHTLNLRLHPNDLAYIATHADDKAVIVDRTLLPLLEQFRERTPIEHVFVVEDSYEELLASADPDAYSDPGLDEDEAAAMCYTSGTTGMPKGVLYSHRSTILHTLGQALASPLGLHVTEKETLLPVVPMFHANAWGYPYTCAMVGAKLVFPGPHLDAQSLLEDFEQEGVTIAAGVPTIWMGLLQLLDKDPERYDLSKLHSMLVGGSAAPRAMIAGFKQRHGKQIVHGWGMTETSPLATVSDYVGDVRHADEETQLDFVAMQGLPLPLVELRARGDDGADIPWDEQTMGELEVRGPWVASAYYETPEQSERWTDDGWFKTGDIVSFHPLGYIQIKDRSKDVIKSGGEWISSVELENALMAHPAVAEAAVIAIPHEKWDERPLAVVVLREGESASPDELRDFLAPEFAKWWLPDAYEFVAEIPKTAVGKFRKTALREQFAQKPVSQAPSSEMTTGA
jgi:acyl-CoA synthetase (AMP-forming)/AMP-acid ligase II